LLCAAGACFGQSPTGTIAGMLTDPSRAAITGAKVTVVNGEMAVLRELVTGPQGSYSATALAAGGYEVRAEAPGFVPAVRKAEVAAGMTTTVDFSLAVGATSEVVTIEGASSQLNYESHAIDGTVTRVEIENLPLNGRNFLELAKLE